MAKVQINFTALHGAQYTLTIGDPTDTATALEGTRDVFTTTEEDDTDVFMPVRCTSGTVRFYNEGGAWSTLADVSDTHTPVVLSQGSSAVWSGYINKGYVGTRRLYGYNEECEICVQCPLSELDTEMYDPHIQGQVSMMTISQIIAGILTIGSESISYTPPTDLDVGTMLGLSLSSVAFYKEFTNDNGQNTFEPKYTKKEALESIMTLLCCTAVWDGTQVIISAFKPTTASIDDEDLTEVIDPADMECSETAVMPYKKIKVTADANGRDTMLQFPTRAMQDWVEANTGNAVPAPVMPYEHPKRIAWIWGILNQTTSPAWQEIEDSEFDYSYEDISDSGARAVGYENIEFATQKSYYNLGAAVFLHYTASLPVGTSTVYCPTLVVSTKSPIMVQDAYLAFTARLKKNFLVTNDFDGILDVCVRIGNYVYDYDKSAWVNQQADIFFEVPYANSEVLTSENLNIYYGNVTGYGIPVLNKYDNGTVTAAVLNGIFTIKIRTHNHDGGTDFSDDVITIETMDVKVVRRRISLDERNIFTATGQRGRGDNDIQLDYCSQRQKENADNFLYSNVGTQQAPDYASVKLLYLDGVSQRPEQWVANRHAAMTTNKARSLLTIRQNGNFASGKYIYNSKLYSTLSISHEWAANITEAHLIEIS